MTVFLTVMIGAGCAGFGYLLRAAEESWKTAAHIISEARDDDACPCPSCRDAPEEGPQ